MEIGKGLARNITHWPKPNQDEKKSYGNLKKKKKTFVKKSVFFFLLLLSALEVLAESARNHVSKFQGRKLKNDVRTNGSGYFKRRLRSRVWGKQHNLTKLRRRALAVQWICYGCDFFEDMLAFESWKDIFVAQQMTWCVLNNSLIYV